MPTARSNRRSGVCGLCGRKGKLTNTHVPARCAGNTGHVRRFTVMSGPDDVAIPSRKNIGGLHFYGLCETCNGPVQNRWEGAYCSFARELWPLASSARLYLPGRIAMPDIDIFPGAVARSVLASCFALNPNLRNLYPELARALISDADVIDLPVPMDFYLALTRGPTARVTGSVAGFHLFGPEIGGHKVGLMTMAQIYFPPLAWQLADTPTSPKLEIEGWRRVTNWLRIAAADTMPLRELVSDLPFVFDPRRAGGGPSDWIELLGDETTFVVEGDNAHPSAWA